MKIRSWKTFTRRERGYFRNTVDRKAMRNIFGSSSQNSPIGS